MKYRFLLFAALAFACASVPSAARLAAQPGPAGRLAPDAFAQGAMLDVAREAPVHAVLLPHAVYATATRADLGDVRVFNAGGEELPHAVFRGSEPARSARHVLPFFPIHGPAGTGALHVQVRRTPEGALVQVEDRPAGAAPYPVHACVVDASGVDVPIRQLRFTWPDTASFLAVVVVETSDDLSVWQAWGAPVTLARLRYGGETLLRDDVTLPPRRVRYVRLSRPGGTPLPVPERIEAVEAAREAPERAWVRLAPASEGGVYTFDQVGVLPVDRVRFELPQPNTLARVVLASAAGEEGPWQERYRGLLYRLRVDGHDLASAPLDVARTTDRYWRLTVDPAGGGLGQGAPVLGLGWTPERLIFVARGAPPYTLAFGSAAVAPSAFDPEELLRLVPGGRDDLFGAGIATAGPVFELGGAARLRAAEGLPWGRIVLWSVLVLGVAVLAAMSVRLLRQIDRDRREAVGGGA